MSAWSDEEAAYEEYARQQQEFAYNEWREREMAWVHRNRPGGIEEVYQNWCREHGLDPEDVGTMVAYEEE